MYKKITMKLLVTTDFSSNSKAAIRFAQQIATQNKAVEVYFYHSVHIMKPTIWSDAFFKKYKKNELTTLMAELKKFVSTVIKKDKHPFSSIKYAIGTGLSAKDDILQFAKKEKVSYICIATKGAGILRKIWGTNTAYIVNNTNVPVLAIPSHYKSKTIKNITYLSDMENIKAEIANVVKFANSITSAVQILHYQSAIDNKEKFNTRIKILQNEGYKNIKLNVVKNNLEKSLVERVAGYVKHEKPELLVMFTKKEKSFYERIFLPSKSVELTYGTKVPVLIFSK
jgi:nucleotide-binding universal stress UspA family protein